MNDNVTFDVWVELYSYRDFASKIITYICTVWHKSLAVENFNRLLTISILADKTLVDWLSSTAN